MAGFRPGAPLASHTRPRLVDTLNKADAASEPSVPLLRRRSDAGGASANAGDAAADVDPRLLMLQVQRGEMPAFEALFARFHKPLFNFFLRLCFRREMAEDLVQDTFLRLWRTAGRYQPTAKFTTYLFQVAKNLWLNESEKATRRKMESLDTASGADAGSSTEVARDHSSSHGGPATNPLDEAVASDLQRVARDALAELDEKHRLVLVLSHFQGFKYREIAEILEIPEGTVKTRMMHAERKLREKLEHLKLFD